MKANSIYLMAVGAGSLLGSFAIPIAAIPLQALSFGLFVAAEFRYRYEAKYLLPLETRRHQAWQETLDHVFEHQTGAAQAYTTNRLDWRYRQLNTRLNLRGSIREKYLQLFTQSQPPGAGVQGVGEVIGQATHPSVDRSVQPQQTLTMTATSSPAATGTTEQADRSVSATELPLLNLNHLLKAPFVLIWGCPGGGKTTLAKRLATIREEAGHTITVADPHGSKAEWGDWELVGAGRNFKALDQYLAAYDEAITADYERYAAGEREFDYQTLIVDEFTQWADRCVHSPLFVKSICTDLRKICRCAIVVSHADTLTGLGNAVGLKAAINRSAVKIELETQISSNGEYAPTGEGWLQYPGKERQRVRIPHAEPT